MIGFFLHVLQSGNFTYASTENQNFNFQISFSIKLNVSLVLKDNYLIQAVLPHNLLQHPSSVQKGRRSFEGCTLDSLNHLESL